MPTVWKWQKRWAWHHCACVQKRRGTRQRGWGAELSHVALSLNSEGLTLSPALKNSEMVLKPCSGVTLLEESFSKWPPQSWVNHSPPLGTYSARWCSVGHGHYLFTCPPSSVALMVWWKHRLWHLTDRVRVQFYSHTQVSLGKARPLPCTTPVTPLTCWWSGGD